MASLLFVDENGQDHKVSPYEVLAGIAIEDRDLWNLITALQDSEMRIFGRRYTPEDRELKAKKIIKTKTYRLARQLPPFNVEERSLLARQCLDEGACAGRRQITALAQAKLAYVQETLEMCAHYRCRVFACIVPKNSPRPEPGHLRKDYAYLLERFYYYLEDKGTVSQGIVVFDELEKSQSHLLVDQMDRYFKFTNKGRQRAAQIIPEPFFVHSDLTTGIQLADLVAYIISWGYRFGDMQEPARSELNNLATLVGHLRYRTMREVGDNSQYVIWSITTIADLRPKDEQEL